MIADFTFPLRLGRGGNDRHGHRYAAAAARAKEREATFGALHAYAGLGAQALARELAARRPLVVTLTRCSPGTLDDDNLVASLKGVRDEVARWIGIDDRHRDRVLYTYAQARAPWGVRVQIAGAPAASKVEAPARRATISAGVRG